MRNNTLTAPRLRMLATLAFYAATMLTAACSTREALIGAGAAAAGVAAGAYVGDRYDVDVDKKDQHEDKKD